MFAKNESTIDRVIRLIVGAGLVIVSLTSFGLASAEPLGIVLVVLGAVLLFTAATGTCLLYKLIGVDTKK